MQREHAHYAEKPDKKITTRVNRPCALRATSRATSLSSFSRSAIAARPTASASFASILEPHAANGVRTRTPYLLNMFQDDDQSKWFDVVHERCTLKLLRQIQDEAYGDITEQLKIYVC